MAGGAYIIIALSFGLAAGFIGKLKGSSFFLWFLIGLIVPFIGMLCAILYRSDREELRRECDRCGRIVKLHDALCTGCGHELEFPDRAVISEQEEFGAGRA